MRKYGSVIISLAIVLFALRTANWAVKRLGGPLPPVPSPNAYSDLVRLGAKLSGLKEISNLSSNQFTEIAQKYQPDLLKGTELVGKPSATPLQTRVGWSEEHESDLQALKTLAVGLILEEKFALKQGRTNDAVAFALSALKLGHIAVRGGVRVDALTGMVIQVIANAELQSILPKLGTEQLRTLIPKLEKLESERESVESILARETLWVDKTFGLVSWVGNATLRSENKKRANDLRVRYAKQIRLSQQTLLRAGARLFNLETGKSATTPEELVPKYISRVPTDPETGKPVRQIPPEPFL